MVLEGLAFMMRGSVTSDQMPEKFLSTEEDP